MFKKYLELFISFFKIGAFTIGSGYAMIPLIEVEVVNKKKWIEEEEFVDMLSLAQSCPGAISLNIAVFVGFRLAGFFGGLITIVSVILAPVLVVLFISMFLIETKDNPVVIKVLKGLKPAICSLMIYTLFSFIKKAKTISKMFKYVIIAAAVTFCVIKLSITPILFIIAAPIVSISFFMIRERIEAKKGKKANIDGDKDDDDGEFLE